MDYADRILALHASLSDEVQMRQQVERQRDRCQAENTQLVTQTRDLNAEIAQLKLQNLALRDAIGRGSATIGE